MCTLIFSVRHHHLRYSPVLFFRNTLIESQCLYWLVLFSQAVSVRVLFSATDKSVYDLQIYWWRRRAGTQTAYMTRTDNSAFICNFLSEERRSCKPIRKQISKLLCNLFGPCTYKLCVPHELCISWRTVVRHMCVCPWKKWRPHYKCTTRSKCLVKGLWAISVLSGIIKCFHEQRDR